MITKCEECGNTKITFYRQARKDGVIVVTARCGNNHHPKRGKPFYPTYNFKLETLPFLPTPQKEEKQINFLFEVK